MGRSKQSARRSMGGSAPASQSSIMGMPRSATTFKTYMTTQQSLGRVQQGDARAERNRTSFVNAENTLGQFTFRTGVDPATPVPSFFQPSFAAARSVHPLDATPQHFVSVNFSSKLDGDGIHVIGRPPLDLVVSLDVSGSMGSMLQAEREARGRGSRTMGNSGRVFQRKLDVAKRCLIAVYEALHPDDTLAIVTFNHSNEVQMPATCKSALSSEMLHRIVDNMRASGRTDLYAGFLAGLTAFADTIPAGEATEGIATAPCATDPTAAAAATAAVAAAAAAAADGPAANGVKQVWGSQRMRRIIFLTDMQSSLFDEDQVLSEAAQRASGTYNAVDDASLSNSVDGGRDGSSSRSSIACGSASIAQLSDTNVQRSAVGEGPSEKKQRSKRAQAHGHCSADGQLPSLPERVQRAYIATTIVGVDVDLSVASVERISSMRGGRYISVTSAAEFERSVAEEFAYDVTPVAHNISFRIAGGDFAFHKAFGSAELNAMQPGATRAQLSSEFPSPVCGTTNGALVFQLRATAHAHDTASSCKAGPAGDGKQSAAEAATAEEEGGKAVAASVTGAGVTDAASVAAPPLCPVTDTVSISMSWTELDGSEHERVFNVDIPPLPARDADASLQARCAVVHAEDEEEGARRGQQAELFTARAVAASCNPVVTLEDAAADLPPAHWATFGNNSIRKAVALIRYVVLQQKYVVEDGPNDAAPESERLAYHRQQASNFRRFLDHFLSEMCAVGEPSVVGTGTNRNVSDTILQMYDAEVKEVRHILNGNAAQKRREGAFDLESFAPLGPPGPAFMPFPPPPPASSAAPASSPRTAFARPLLRAFHPGAAPAQAAVAASAPPPAPAPAPAQTLPSTAAPAPATVLFDTAVWDAYEKAAVETPEHLQCPITLSLLRDPVLLADGHSYERAAIVDWLASHNTSPKTNEVLPHFHLTPNYALRSAIQDHVRAVVPEASTAATASPISVSATAVASASASASTAAMAAAMAAVVSAAVAPTDP